MCPTCFVDQWLDCFAKLYLRQRLHVFRGAAYNWGWCCCGHMYSKKQVYVIPDIEYPVPEKVAFILSTDKLAFYHGQLFPRGNALIISIMTEAAFGARKSSCATVHHLFSSFGQPPSYNLA